MSLNSFRTYYFLGLALTGDRRYADAVQALSVALDLDPSHIQANVASGDALLLQGNIDDASPFYYRALKLRAEYPGALDGLARVAEAQADDDRAISFYERAIASDKGFAAAYMHLGDLYLRKGRLDDAVKLLVESVRIRPDFGPGLNRLAAAYGRLGFSNEAVATIRKAIELEPNNAEHRSILGHVLLGMGVDGGAAAAFQEAVKLDPGEPKAHAGLAELARRRGRYDEALKEIDLALADPRLDRRQRDIATAQRATILSEKTTVADLEGRAAAGTASTADMQSLAELLAGRGEWSHAALMLEATAPQDGARERLAYYYFRSGRFRDAHDAYAALAQGASRGDLEINDGAALARLGSDTQAIEAFDRALKLDPTQDRALLYRANALLRLGRPDDAAGAYKRFLEVKPDGESAEQVRRILAQLSPAPPAPPAPKP
jgi:tetratricopeptide (TPR) repeat protein